MRPAWRLSVLLSIFVGYLIASIGSVFAQNNPVPTLSSILPTTAAAGSGATCVAAAADDPAAEFLESGDLLLFEC